MLSSSRDNLGIGSLRPERSALKMIPPERSDRGPDARPLADSYRLFVGRDKELEAMVRAFEDASAGRGTLLLLAGEPGIGKTRLSDELATRSAEEGAVLLWGRCWEEGGAPAFWPWIQALRELIRSLDDEGLRTALGSGPSEIAQLLPELNERLAGIPALPPASPDAARFRLFQAIGDLLRRASQERPIVLILEDLHAADASSVLLLRFLADGLPGSRVLLIGTYRDVDLRPDQPLALTLPELLRIRGALRLTLPGLGRQEIARLVEAISGLAPSERLVAAILEQTEGNPLFVREIVQLLSAEGRLAAPLEPGRWPVPQGVREVIARRLDRLGPEPKRALSVASVLGRDFTVSALERVLGQAPEEVLESLREGLWEQLIAEVAGAPGRFRFAHSLIGDTLYEDLDPAERVRLHGVVGEALEALYASDLESHLAELARHFFEALPGGDTDKAVQYARRAGERAIDQVAYEEAVRLFRMALVAVERSPDEQLRCVLLLSLGDALARAGEGAAARETFLDAAAIATRLNLAEMLARAAVGYGGRFVFARAGPDRHLIPLLEQALAALGPGDSGLRVRVLSRLAGALRDQPTVERRAALSREAVEMARRIGDPETLIHALIGRWGAGDLARDALEEQLELADELNRLAEEVGDRERLMDPCWVRFIYFMTVGRVAEARAQLQLASRLADELGQPSHRWLAGQAVTTLALQDGRLSEAEDLIERVHEMGRRVEQWWAGASSLFEFFVLRREQGRLAQLEGDLRRALDEYPGYRSFRCMVLVSLCELGRLDEARRLFDRLAVDDFRGLPKGNEWLCTLTLLTEAVDVLDDRNRAATLYDLLAPYAGQVVLIAAEVSLGPVFRPLGMLASLMGQREAARRHFEDSMAMCERMGARPWLAHSQYQFGRMLMGGPKEDRDRAVELLGAAHEICETAEMTALKEKVTQLLEKLGHGPRRPSRRTVGGQKLTPRERESVPSQPAGVFLREGEYFAITYEGDTFRLREVKGLRYLAHLLANPGREIHAIDLTQLGEGRPAPAPGLGGRPGPGLDGAGFGDGGEVLDSQARSAYRGRLEELQGELEDAESFGDAERATRIKEEMDFLARELAGGVGLGGRARRAGSPAERARVNVTKAIKVALARIARHSPSLRRHLDATLRTGTFCSYTPDPRASVTWRT